jgi:hypothetical protein
MYDNFSDCEHIIAELCDYAIRHRVSIEAVDDAMNHAYMDNRQAYDNLQRFAGMEYEKRHHALNVQVLERFVRPRLEELAESGRR